MKKTVLVVLGIVILILLVVLYLPKIKKQSAINQNVTTPSPTMPSETQPITQPQEPVQEPIPPSEPTMTTPTSEAPQPKTFEIAITDAKFSVDKIEVKSKEGVAIKLINKDESQYVFGWREKELQQVPTAVGALVPKGEVTFTFTAPEKKGEYCLVIEYPFNLADRQACTGSVLKVLVK